MTSNIQEQLTDILLELCSSDGPSGNESSAVKTAMSYFEPYGEIIPLGLGSFACITNKGAKHTLLLDAHIDEIAMIVTAIEDGFVRIAPVGGVDRRVLLSQEVTIHAKQDISGVFCTLPPHLMKAGEDEKYPDFDEYAIDTGLGKEAEQLISLGDYVTLRRNAKKLLNNRITSKAIDDRAGVAVLLGALKLLEGQYNDTCIISLISTQEETGERGAKVGSFSLDYDAAIAVDVSFAQAPDVSPRKAGKMGNGPMIGISPYIDRNIYDNLVQTAKQLDIPYQVEVMGGATGTNLDVITSQKGGCPGGLISIPQRNMHTPAEVVDMTDVENCAKLLAGFIKGGYFND